MMKRNMSFIVLVLVVLCLNTNRAIAQDRSYEGTITIVPVRLEQLGETVHSAVSFSYYYLRASTGFHQREKRVSGS